VNWETGKAESLNLVCESLRNTPAASILVRHSASGWQNRASLDSGVHYVVGPRGKWFSPLYLGNYFLRFLTGQRQNYPGGARFMIPEEYVSSATFDITPEIPTGHALAPFDFGEVDLSQWMIAR
jgi:hypothetical protein